jgi:hypothetical protein
MKRLALIAVFAAGCATLQPTADPLIVRVEQAQKSGLAIVDAFEKFDLANPQLPNSVHKVADHIRDIAPSAFRSLDDARRVYEASKSADAQSKLALAVSTVEGIVSQVNAANAK